MDDNLWTVYKLQNKNKKTITIIIIKPLLCFTLSVMRQQFSSHTERKTAPVSWKIETAANALPQLHYARRKSRHKQQHTGPDLLQAAKTETESRELA